MDLWPATPVRQAIWNAQPPQMEATDKISVRNLEVTVNAGVDVWGRQKKQRALITVTISLAQTLDSAAEADALDSSTIHYGKLSKHIQSLLQDDDFGWMKTGDLALQIRARAFEMRGQTRIASVEVDVFYPKGSMLGDGAGYSHALAYSSNLAISRVLYLRNVRVPCIIGVNSNERLHKQPVVVNLWIECVPEERSDDYPMLESAIVNVISNSSFETLESLSTAVVRELRTNFFDRQDDKEAFIRLRIEKPLAVPFADAPAIEILRPVG